MARRKKRQRRGRATGAPRPGSVRPGSVRPVGAGARRALPDFSALGLWLLLLVPPLIFLPGLTDTFRLPKLLASELFALLSLALLSLRAWPWPPPKRSGEDADGSRDAAWRRIVDSPAILATVPVLLVGSLGLFFGDHADVTRRALPSLWIGGACLVVWSLALRPDERQRFLRLTLWPAGLLSLFAILQFHQIFDPFSFQDRVTDRTGLTSLAGGAFDLSGYLVLPLLLAQAWWAEPEGRSSRLRRRVLLGVFLILGLWATVAARTVTVLAALGLGTFFLWRRAVPLKRLAAAAGIGAAVLAVLVTVGPLKERASNLGKSLQQGEINRLLTGRLDAWRGSFWMIEEHPLLGVGHGAFRAEYGPARLELSEQGVEFFRGQKQVFFTNAHSDLLNAVAEWGLLGLAALLFAAAVLFKALRHRWSRQRTSDGEADEGPEQATGPDPRDFELAALAALGVLCTTYFPFHLALLAFPWLLFLSGLLAPVSSTEGAASSPGSASAGAPSRRSKVRRLVTVSLLALFASALFLRFGQARDLLGASRLVAAAEASIMQMAGSQAVPPALLRRNLEWLRRAGEMDPAEVGVPSAEGGHFFLMQRHDAALRAYDRAAALEMRAEIFANKARVLLAAGRREEAIEAIETAIALDLTQHRVFSEVLNEQRRRERAARE